MFNVCKLFAQDFDKSLTEAVFVVILVEFSALCDPGHGQASNETKNTNVALRPIGLTFIIPLRNSIKVPLRGQDRESEESPAEEPPSRYQNWKAVWTIDKR